MLSHGNTRDSLRERVAEIRIAGAAAVARVPGGVDRELHQIGEPPDLLRSGGLAAGQISKLLQADGLSTS